ncbi:rhodanese-like domain-containing protein [Shewanella acanthi]|nr:rhodanese-like domain-containing protein [Shewanella acanthi]
MFQGMLYKSRAMLSAALIGFVSMLMATTSTAAEQVQPQDPAIAWQMIDKGAMVLDVRTPEEFAEGHLANAVNIPYEIVADEFAKRGIDKDTPVVVYCRSGRRSGIAIEALSAAGYNQTYNGGGYEQLNEARLKKQ